MPAIKGGIDFDAIEHGGISRQSASLGRELVSDRTWYRPCRSSNERHANCSGSAALTSEKNEEAGYGVPNRVLMQQHTPRHWCAFLLKNAQNRTSSRCNRNRFRRRLGRAIDRRPMRCVRLRQAIELDQLHGGGSFLHFLVLWTRVAARLPLATELTPTNWPYARDEAIYRSPVREVAPWRLPA